MSQSTTPSRRIAKLEKAILAEAMELYRESGRFPVKSFDMRGSEVIARRFKGTYALMNRLVAACHEYAEARKK